MRLDKVAPGPGLVRRVDRSNAWRAYGLLAFSRVKCSALLDGLFSTFGVFENVAQASRVSETGLPGLH